MAVSKNTIVITSKGPKGERGSAVTADGTEILSFSTVAVTGSTDIVADEVNDTVTVEGGGGTTVTGSGSTLTISSEQLTVKDESVDLTTSASSLNFVGTGVEATTVGDDVTVTISGGGGAGATSYGDVVIGGVTTLSPATDGDDLKINATQNITISGVDVTDTILIGGGRLIDESTPQLAGQLDVTSYAITTTTTNADVFVYPNGTGAVSLGSNTKNNNVNITPGLVEVKNDGSDQSAVKLYCESSETHYVQVKSPAHSGTYVSYDFVLPETAGTSGQFLQTDGSGNTTWATGGSATELDGQEIKYEVRSGAMSATGHYEGLVSKLTGTETTLTTGMVYCWSGTAWVPADASSAANSDGTLGIALGVNNTSGFLIEGVVYYASSTPGSADGDVLYLDPAGTGFRMTSTAPTSDGNILRVVGQRLDANKVLFKPSQDFVELGAAAGTTGLSDLSDAAVTTPAAGHLLIYDNTDSQFENATLTAGTNVTITNADASITIDACDGTEIEFASQASAVSTAGEAEGTIVKFGTGTLTAGKVYTFSSGAWVAVDANAEATTKGLLGMALGTSPTTNGLLVHGVGYLDHDPGTAGDTLYIGVGATAGQLTGTQPTDAADFVRVVGYCLADNKVFFSPSQDYIDLA